MVKNNMTKVVVDSERVENLMLENNVEEMIKLCNFYKDNGVLEDMLDFRYCLGRCNFFHAIVKHSKGETVTSLCDYVISTMSHNFFLNSVNVIVDKYARNMLIIAAKHQDMPVVLNLMINYGLSPNFYCRYNKMSALSYLLKRKKYVTAMRVLEHMDPDQMLQSHLEWFQEDLDKIRENVSPVELMKEEWLMALTTKYLHKARKTKYRKAELIYKTSFENNRLRQTMRHIALQLYMRWSAMLDDVTLDDVQLMYIEKKGDKANPYPRPCLFIACTPPYAADLISQDFKSKTLKELVLSEYETEDDTENFRATRYRRKLMQRYWEQQQGEKTTKESKKLGELLKSEVKRIQKTVKVRKGIKMPYFEYSERTAYLVTPDNYNHKGVHAEEILCDISNYLNAKQLYKTHIYGKARSCVSCVGRMKLSTIDGYNKHPGFIWINTIDEENLDAAKEIVSLLFDSSTYVSHFPQEMLDTPAFDTASDSE